MSEQVREVPLFEKAAAELKGQGTSKLNLTGQDLAGIIRGVVGSFVSGQERVKANITSMNADIKGQKGTVSGEIGVKEPIKATIKVDFLLANDTTPGEIGLVQLNIKEEAGLFVKLALGAVNIKGRIQEALSDPNEVLRQAFADQLEPRGAKLTGAEFNFTDKALLVLLRGEPVQGR